MAPLDDDERQALIDGLHRAVARAKAICARAELACRDAQAVRLPRPWNAHGEDRIGEA